MLTIGTIIAPHPALDSEKVAALVAAYQGGEDVPLVRVLDFGHSHLAIEGSHRLAALSELDLDVGDYVQILDGEEIYAAAAPSLRGMLDDLLSGRGLDYDELAQAIGAAQ